MNFFKLNLNLNSLKKAVVTLVAFPFRMLVGVVNSSVIIVVLIDTHYSFVHLTDHTLALFELINFTIYHYELVFYVPTGYLRVHLLIT